MKGDRCDESEGCSIGDWRLSGVFYFKFYYFIVQLYYFIGENLWSFIREAEEKRGGGHLAIQNGSYHIHLELQGEKKEWSSWPVFQLIRPPSFSPQFSSCISVFGSGFCLGRTADKSQFFGVHISYCLHIHTYIFFKDTRFYFWTFFSHWMCGK